ncbi:MULTISPECIES: hypothetical protein [Paraburkholderia]|uniref:Uncharacterized protein n=1 Tax=Paraburkholderia madseniana TaxID=2599607 RepID=A0AAP5BER8_9BURK|nr:MULTISPECIES: hypothetical protein [Paraburkholderia]MCX4146908.1 hypothetical protein [Paraburkholderia madseniana]MDN7149854.1 hypothetical protein [Paraburkholderia sp. WS6]MDQ6408734.1 hypothetical protein [Paraburkholderia madseniana]
MTVLSRPAFVLAVGATSTALSLSVLAGWQRGGSLPERVVWVSVGVVLLISAHLLPALIREAPFVVRSTGSLLWVTCLATACYGHAQFFLFAQQHAGERRASTVTAVGIAEPGRSLTVVMSERATVTRQLAFARAQRCARDCPVLEARRMTLAAKLDALDGERDDIRRSQAENDWVTAKRDALRADPVTPRLAALLGTTTARVDLLSGLAFAAVLEGVACLLWTVALRSSPLPAQATVVTPPAVAPLPEPVVDVPRVTQPAVTAVTPDHALPTVSCETVSNSHEAPDDPLSPLPVADAADVDVTQLARDIAAGRVRATVADIRRHLGCSQARAVALRRQLAERNVTA